MKRNPLVVIFDVTAAIDGIFEATQGRSLAEFKGNWLLRHGVQRGIEIISEAVRHLPPDLLAAYPDTPWPKIRAVGNVIRHDYNVIADDIIWRVVADEPPALREVMTAMKRKLDEAKD